MRGPRISEGTTQQVYSDINEPVKSRTFNKVFI